VSVNHYSTDPSLWFNQPDNACDGINLGAHTLSLLTKNPPAVAMHLQECGFGTRYWNGLRVYANSASEESSCCPYTSAPLYCSDGSDLTWDCEEECADACCNTGTCYASVNSNEDLRTAVSEWLDNPASAKIIYGEISDWDVSEVTDMSYLFGFDGTAGSSNDFNDDISSWDVSSVTTMYGMFNVNQVFNQNISSWNVSSCMNFAYMLHDAKNFNQTLCWNIPAAATVTQMFNVDGTGGGGGCIDTSCNSAQTHGDATACS